VCEREARRVERTLSWSSLINLKSSWAVSLIRSRSLRSTTQMMASIPCEQMKRKLSLKKSPCPGSRACGRS
jgi:ERCC4-type nuclease